MLSLRLIVAFFASFVGLVLSLPVLGIALPFWIVSFSTRKIARLFTPNVLSWQEIIQFDALLGWKIKPSIDAHCSGEPAPDLFHVVTDSEGLRGPGTVAESKIVVFGDSFAFGYGVDDRECYFKTNGLAIKAVGAPGYNMAQELLCMRHLSQDLTGKLVVWFIYFGNDLYENLVPDMCGYRTPFVRAAKNGTRWEIVNDHIAPAKWFHYSSLQHRTKARNYYGKLAQLCSSNFLSERAYSACEHLIRQGKDLCNRSGARLVVVTVPDKFQLSLQGQDLLRERCPHRESFDPEFPDRQISAICQKLAVRYVALKDYLPPTSYKHDDCHWNAEGHRQVAEILGRLYRDTAAVQTCINESEEQFYERAALA
jgi:hypothetical protein